MMQNWKKNEKGLYLPGVKPEMITVPAFNFFMIAGEGNPNDKFFGNYIQVLYGLSYAVKMSPRSGHAPQGYYDYSVYPLEGIWDLAADSRKNYAGKINKEDLVFNLMIRQPDFVNTTFALETIERVKKRKPDGLMDRVKFGSLEEGVCVQLMHLGSYDDEPASFALMEAFCERNGLKRKSRQHREIYLSDARRVSADKLKTVLRIMVT